MSEGYSASAAIQWCAVKFKDNDAGYNELKYLIGKGYSLEQSVKLQRSASYYETVHNKYIDITNFYYNLI